MPYQSQFFFLTASCHTHNMRFRSVVDMPTGYRWLTLGFDVQLTVYIYHFFYTVVAYAKRFLRPVRAGLSCVAHSTTPVIVILTECKQLYPIPLVGWIYLLTLISNNICVPRTAGERRTHWYRSRGIYLYLYNIYSICLVGWRGRRTEAFRNVGSCIVHGWIMPAQNALSTYRR